MEDNKEVQEVASTPETEVQVSKEIGDFNFLISTVVEYYEAKAGMRGEMEEGDEWKKDTKYERINIPDRIDNMVEKAFLTQLKKFC